MTDGEILAAFCARDEEEALRYEHLQWPFRQGGFVIGTNGRAVVLRPATDDDAGIPGHDRPFVAAGKDNLLSTACFSAEACDLALPDLVMHATRCADCRDGQRAVMEACKACSGIGYCDCPKCGDNHACGRCGGKGEVLVGHVPCATCGATGKVMGPKHMRFGPAVIDGRYAEILAKIGGAKFRMPTAALDAVHFAAGIYAIMVMPMKSYSEADVG